MNRNRWDDHYARRARDEKWLARSVYKLQEIDKIFHIIHKGDSLLDLGCYPGSWSQYVLKKVGKNGEVAGIDIVRPTKILNTSNFKFIQGDVLTMKLEQIEEKVGPRDSVISDLAPKTTGIKSTDAARSILLATRAFEIASTILKKDGNFVVKVLEGGDFKAFKTMVSIRFREIRLFRPKSTRKRSREIYIVGLEFS